MSSFSYDKRNDKLYLTYVADVAEIVDGYSLGIIINNPIVGITQTLFSNDENGKKFTYDITGTISLKELIKKGIDEKMYMCLLASVSTTLNSCEQYGLNIGSLILNEELIYCNEEKGLVYFICIPTSGFITSVHTREVLAMFSNVLMTRMEVTTNAILEINEYLVGNPDYVFADFIYKINEYLVANKVELPGIVQDKTIQTVYKEEPEKTRQPEDRTSEAENVNEEVSVVAESNMENIIDSHIEEMVNDINAVPMANDINVVPMANDINGVPVVNDVNIATGAVAPALVERQTSIKDILKDKMEELSKVIDNIKNSQVIRNIKEKVKGDQLKNTDMEQSVQNVNQQGIVQNAQPVMQGNMMYQVDPQSDTLMLDCVTGETEGRNSISTAEPYLIRVSTGERININRSNFKLGRSKKNADYFMEGNDTISKVHAYITNKANQYFIVDNASSNRTFLNGKVINPIEENRLAHESKIRLAKEEFVFYLY